MEGSRLSTRDETVTVDHDGVLDDAFRAKLFATAVGPVWIPKLEMLAEGDDTFEIPRWLAEDRGLV